jgi:leucyl-tRNA synthetase
MFQKTKRESRRLWPEKVRLMQRNWIGRPEGLLIRFALDPATTPNAEDELFGAKFMALSPDHPRAAAAAQPRACRIHRRMQTPRHRARITRQGLSRLHAVQSS